MYNNIRMEEFRLKKNTVKIISYVFMTLTIISTFIFLFFLMTLGALANGDYLYTFSRIYVLLIPAVVFLICYILFFLLYMNKKD